MADYFCDKNGNDSLHTFRADIFPEPENKITVRSWIYGRAEREVFLQQQLIREKNEAKL